MAATDIPPNVAQLTGPALIGFAAQWGLYGCSSVQVYLYYLNFPKDRWPLKTLVYGLYALDSVQTFLVTAFVFNMLAAGWGNVAMLESVGLSWLALPLFNAITGTTVQCFYAWRIYTLSKSIPLAAVITILALLEGSAGLAFSIILVLKVPSFAEVQSKTLTVTTVCLMASAACDILISVSMIYLLNRARRATNYGNTEKLLSRLIRLIIGGGALTATFAILDAAFLLAYQNNNYHLAPNAALAKLYTNALMVLFNSRARVESDYMYSSNYTWDGEGTRRPRSGAAATFDRSVVRNPAAISVDVSVDYASDSPPVQGFSMGNFESTNSTKKGSAL